ncbi:MAG: hypothetical protein SFU87_04835 [Chitinophagaceae bacterium]|nr:hypothetical protein [Chitinophagaceae bacterium]
MARIIKLKVDKGLEKKELTSFQKKLLRGPVMSEKQYREWLKEKKNLYKWKVS